MRGLTNHRLLLLSLLLALRVLSLGLGTGCSSDRGDSSGGAGADANSGADSDADSAQHLDASTVHPDAQARGDSDVDVPDGDFASDGGVRPRPPEDAAADGGTQAGVTGLPERLDFVRTVLGEARARGFTLENRSAAPVTVHIGDIGGEAKDDFVWMASPPIDASGHTLPPGDTLALTVRFAPASAGVKTASIAFDLCASGCTEVLALRGEAQPNAITCEPSAVNFGFTSLGTCARSSIVCANASILGAVISSAHFGSDRSSFSFSTPPSVPTGLSPGARQTFDVSYCPTPPSADQGDDRDLLEIDTINPDQSHAMVHVELTGRSGGPAIECTPSSLEFGSVAIESATRATVRCRNLGSLDLVLSRVAFTRSSDPHFTVLSRSPESIEPGAEAEIVAEFSSSTAGTFEGILEVESNDPDRPLLTFETTAHVVDPTTSCALSISSRTISMGAVPIGSVANAYIVVENVGRGVCGIQNIGLTASTSPQYTLMNTPTSATLDPGSTRVLGVRFTPTAVGQYVGTVEFATTDPALSSPVSVEFPAQGVAASHPLGIRPSIIDFATVKANCANTQTQRLAIRSIGASRTVTATLEPSSSLAFTIQNTRGPIVLVIPGNDEASLVVGFQPATVGIHAGRVRIDADGLPSMFVSLLGVADTTGHNVNRFDIEANQLLVDMLLVVDNSASMEDEQTKLANAAAAMINYADASSFDYHIGVVTTGPDDTSDPHAWGALEGTPSFITRHTPLRDERLRDAILRGTAGSPLEQGLRAAAQAVTDPVLLQGRNAGFLRPGATLAIVVLSDEDDQSPDALSEYLEAINERPNNEGPVRFYSITAGGAGCDAPPSATRYDAIDADTGGFDRPICAPDFLPIVEEIWADALRLALNSSLSPSLNPSAGLPSDPFRLSAEPAPESATIAIDGTPIPPIAGGVVAWSVDYKNHVIVVEEPSFVVDGSTLEIAYDALCVSPTCGDGVPQVGETCDDGNGNDADRCPSTCYEARCSDGFILASVEECDDGNTVAGDGCSPQCMREECGNGILDVAEECDDGILNSDTTADACRTTCTLPICGDGSVDSSEECDDGNTNNDDDCMQNCHAAVCGDGFIQSLIEDCDDGNSNNNDACPSNCLWPETIFTVTSVPNQPLTPTTGAPIFPGPMSDDESVSVSIGFPFSFLSTVVTTVYPSTNGFLSVTDRHPSYSPESLPISGSGVGFIAWWWQDLYFDTSRSPVPAATTALLGTAPHRIRVFTFLNIPRIGSATGNLLNAEIRLYEGTNEIEVHYGELTSGSSLSSHATMGWQSLAGNGGMPLACGAACDDSNWPANTIYRYSPHD